MCLLGQVIYQMHYQLRAQDVVLQDCHSAGVSDTKIKVIEKSSGCDRT